MTTMASVEALTLAQNPAWLAIKRAAGELQTLQSASGAIEDFANHATAAELVGDLIDRSAERTLPAVAIDAGTPGKGPLPGQ